MHRFQPCRYLSLVQLHLEPISQSTKPLVCEGSLWLYACEICLIYETGTSNGFRAVVDLLRMETQESAGNHAGLKDSVEDVLLKGVKKSMEM